jgi:alpha-tubulin suppressor-like RCC1 family protein
MGRVRTHLAVVSAGWGPSGRWFKSSRPDNRDPAPNWTRLTPPRSTYRVEHAPEGTPSLSQAIIVPPTQRLRDRRRLLTGSVLLALCLALLTFSASGQAAGSSALGWGENLYGQTGNGTPTKAGCFCINNPTPVKGLSDATQISAGSDHTLALHAGGTVTAWGYNFAGQLGNGTTSESAAPIPVSGLTDVAAVAAGIEHNLALLANGTVMAWGDNSQGELGVGGSQFGGGGPEKCGTSPCTKVPLAVPGLSDVVAIDAGYYTSLALLGNGTVMAWGYDNTGQLGDGTGSQSGCECADHPVPVQGVSGAMAISLGESHAMALLGNGTVTAWGLNSNGQIGNGTTIQSPPPTCFCVGPTGVSGLTGPVREIAAGAEHSLALLAGGNAQAWGFNNKGQLGNGSIDVTGCECVPTPGAVSGLSHVESVAAGTYHSLALLTDGSVRAWGYNVRGQLGDGSETDRRAPVPVGGVSGASDVSAGEYTSFALLGPSHNLTVSLAGAGAGNVGGPGGIICPAANCAGRFPDSQVAILRAEAAPGSGFAGFTGACTGTGTCHVRMNADQSVTATFGPPKGTMISRATIKQGKKPKEGARPKPKPKAKAIFYFEAPGAVTGYECMLVRPKPKRNRARSGKRAQAATKRRATPRFSSCSSPKRYKKLRKGRYTFSVRGLNALGADSKPAVRKFRIKH